MNQLDAVKDLVTRCNLGERSAWEELYAGYSPKVRLAVKRFCKLENDNEDDLVQEVFIKLMEALKRFNSALPLDVYIVAIARRTAISDLRKSSAIKRGGGMLRRNNRSGSGFDHEFEAAISGSSDSLNQEDLLIRREQAERLRKALAKLSEMCRLLLQMRYEEGVDYATIATEMDCKEGTLRVRVQRCLISLSTIFEQTVNQKDIFA